MNRALLLVAALLAGFLAWRWQVPPDVPVIPHLSPLYGNERQEEEELFEDEADSEPFEHYSSVIDRPLFFKERRPPKPYVPEPARSKPSSKPLKTRAPRIQLSAVVTIGKQTFALVKGGRERVTRRVRTGEEIDGWTVVDISSDRLVLKSGEQRHEVPLRQYRPVLPSRAAPKKSGTMRNEKGKAPDPRRMKGKGPRDETGQPQARKRSARTK